MTGRGYIDVHQHAVFETYRNALESIGVKRSGIGAFPDWSPAKTLALMDESDIDAAVVSIASPAIYYGDIEFTRKLARQCNDDFAKLASDYPRRFGAVGLVPLPDVEAASRELEYALDRLKLDGILLLTHIAGRYLGHPAYDEFFAELDRRSALVVLHPVRPPIANLPEASYPDGYTELVFDTTRAITNMLWNGALHKYPRIRYLMPHGGGVAPFLLFRLAGMDDNPQVRERLPDGVAAHFRRFYYDVAQAAGASALRSILEVAEPSRVMYGSDYPMAFNPEKTIVDTIEAVENYKGFDETMRRNVARDNALALFPRLGT